MLLLTSRLGAGAPKSTTTRYALQGIRISWQNGVMTARRTVRLLHVKARPGDPTRGWLTVAGRHLPVALGRGGIKADKREGDGGMPRGTFRLVRLWWRPDRGPRPQSRL